MSFNELLAEGHDTIDGVYVANPKYLESFEIDFVRPMYGLTLFPKRPQAYSAAINRQYLIQARNKTQTL